MEFLTTQFLLLIFLTLLGGFCYAQLLFVYKIFAFIVVKLMDYIQEFKVKRYNGGMMYV